MIFAAHNTFSEIDPELGTRHHPPTGEADPAAAVLDHYVRQAVGKGSFQDFCSCEQVFLVRQKKLAWTKKTCQGQENLIMDQKELHSMVQVGIYIETLLSSLNSHRTFEIV